MDEVSEMRYDPVARRWVILAAHRSGRPLLPTGQCPFCPGAPEVPDGDWDVKALLNRFPALSLDAPSVEEGSDTLYRRRRSVGACEVILYSPDHDTLFEELSLERVTAIIGLWRERFRELGSLDEIK